MPKWLMRLFFRLLYNQLAWTYDAVAWLVSFGQWKAWGQTALPHVQGPRVLELAHGPGHLLAEMRQRGWQPVGLDRSPSMGKLASQRLRRAKLDLPLVRACAQALPFCDGSFDSAVATFPTEFIIDPNTWQETARVLGAQGRLVIVPGVSFGPRGRQARALPARFLEWLYAVTGQSDSPPPAAWATVNQAGFSLARTRQPMGSVDVLIVIAQKSSPNSTPIPNSTPAQQPCAPTAVQADEETRPAT